MPKRITLELLAQMVAKGFTEIKTTMQNLEQGQEEILLRTGNKADKFELKDLGKRVTKIEKHLGFSG